MPPKSELVSCIPVEHEVNKMASPWKLLARWVSPRREPKEENRSTNDVKPDVRDDTEPLETTIHDGLVSTELRVPEQPQPHDQIGTPIEDLEHARETGSRVQAIADVERDTGVEAAHMALSKAGGAGASDTLKVTRTSEGAKRTRSKRGKKAEAVEVAPLQSTIFDDVVSLDEEIGLLRDQLARKLHLQNMQLRTMLKRFER
ncbi:hypothetical protein [Rhizobium sp. LCM 4573]|uniref:hypothetical protein n=1 Tax=Rhizobium sp. LCM 4573 TaxID=1848291 RepID=UPI001FCD1ED3|nr:hypothetical protein [Rhizobium sp. LCM 4573]